MMKTGIRVLITFLGVLAAQLVMAHTLLMSVNFIDSDQIEVEGAFSTGGPTPGVEMRLEAANGRVIETKKANEHGIATFVVPDEPYYIILDAGQGHLIEEEGPMK